MSVRLISQHRPEQKPIRVLHIVESLDTQAAERWLLRMLQRVSQEFPEHQWSFFCISGKGGRLDETFRQLGATVIHSRYAMNQKGAFLAALRRVMKEGKYDVLHCHHDIISALYLLASIGLPFRKRIVHVHNTGIGMLTPSKLKTGLLRGPMRQVCLGLADRVVGISVDALDAMLAHNKFQPNRDVVIHCGVDTSPFSSHSGGYAAVREGLKLPLSTRLLLFVGRLDSYKNPGFILEIMKCLSEAHSDIAALFAGAGPLETELRLLSQGFPLNDRVRLLGFRDDIPTLMHACDLLIWPSLEEPKEGLGLGVVEAQTAGLPVLMSRSVPEEAIVVPELITVLPLSAGPQAWAHEAIEILNRQHPPRTESRKRVEASSFSMKAGVANLMALYDDLED